MPCNCTYAWRTTYIYIFTNSSPQARCNNFKWSFTDFNSVFSFSYTGCHTKVEELSQLNYLLKTGGKIIGFILFSRVPAIWEIQTASFRVWICITVSIFYDSNHYTMNGSKSLIWFNVDNYSRKTNNVGISSPLKFRICMISHVLQQHDFLKNIVYCWLPCLDKNLNFPYEREKEIFFLD